MLYEKANRLENFIALDKSLYWMFKPGTLTLTPLALGFCPIPILSNHRGAYLL